jgi:hypothetical protein
VPDKPSRGTSLSTVSRAEIAVLILVMAVVASGAMAFAFLA